MAVGGRPRVGELAAFSVEQDVQTWLQDASLWNVVANTNELPHVTRRLLCEQLDDSRWDWAGSQGEIHSHSYASGFPLEKAFSPLKTLNKEDNNSPHFPGA